jgi:hypothetical protein
MIVLLAAILSPLAAQDSRGLNAAAKAISESTPGRQIAVLIAVDKYKEWLPLRFPVRDAKKVKSVLQERYYITDTIELYDQNATKSKILRQFDTLAQELKPEDSVFIYYAGHGHLDDVTDMGFWIPQDAGTDVYEQDNWLPNAQMRALIGRMKARHVMLISDSCFSGDILNASRGTTPAITNDYFRNAYARRSRQVLTSGASEAVPDESAFSRALIRTLEENDKPYLDPYMLFGEIRLSQVTTTPLFGTLSGTDHQEGGSFILFLKDGAGTQAKVPAVAKMDTSTPGKIVIPRMLPGTGLRVNDKAIALWPVSESLDYESSEIPPGKYQVQVTGRYPFTTTLEIKPKDRVVLGNWNAAALAEAQRKRQATEKALSQRKAKTKFGYTSLTIGILGSAGAALTWYLGNAAMDAYNNAQTTDALAEARNTYDLMQSIFYGTAIAGGVGLAASPIFFSGPSGEELERSMKQLDADIRALGGN